MSYPIHLPRSDPILTLTHPKTDLWVIELHNGQDNRLSTRLVDGALMPALDAVEKHWRELWRATRAAKDIQGGKGALIIVGRRDQDKFFSNGLDYENIVNDPNFFTHTFNPFLTRLLTFPIPTVAAINGHCYAGGMMLALTCDYRVMIDGTSRNAWITMNEVHFGATWPLSFAAILRAKFPSPSLARTVALEGHRFSPSSALTAGLLDELAPAGAVLSTAETLAARVCGGAVGGVWGLIKRGLYRDTVEMIARDERIVQADVADRLAKARL